VTSFDEPEKNGKTLQDHSTELPTGPPSPIQEDVHLWLCPLFRTVSFLSVDALFFFPKTLFAPAAPVGPTVLVSSSFLSHRARVFLLFPFPFIFQNLFGRVRFRFLSVFIPFSFLL